MYRDKMISTQSSRSALIGLLQTTLAEKSLETEEHARSMQKLAVDLGRRLELPDPELAEVSLVALLHDVGKVAIREAILTKPGPLSADEWAVMRRHTDIGYRILAAFPDLLSVARGVVAHHERWDGKGYPRGLKAEEIPLSARIAAIVDAFDVMTRDRPYAQAVSREDALEEIMRRAGTQFDPKLTRLFAGILDSPC